MKNFFWISIIILIFFLISHTNSTQKNVEESNSQQFYEEIENMNYYDDFNTYEFSDELVTSENWECTKDCSGHEAGYEWASDNNIYDSSQCDGNSESFIEGCEAYANEMMLEDTESSESYDYEAEENYEY